MTSAALLAIALAAPPAADEARQAMQDADRRFSRASEARDLEGFTQLVAADAVFLSQTGPPALGRAGVRKRWGGFFEPAGPTLTWEPVEAVASERGDLGYTRGRYLLKGRDGEGKPMAETGEYLSIWRKDPDGAWRVVIDSSRPAPPPAVNPAANAPQRLIGQGMSGDLRYSVVATRLPPVTATRPAGDHERRVVKVERRNPDGTWSAAIEAVTVGSAPQL